jgi:hypothetical protein
MTQQFDPAQFVDMETDVALEKRPPLPVGDYTALIGEVTCVPWSSQAKGTSGLRYVVPLKLQVPPSVKEELKLNSDTIQLTDSIMLDQNENGTLDFSPGKNGYLRKYREALGQNVPGEKWSARRMSGQPILVKVKHDVYQGEPVERIDGVAKP